MLRMLNSHKKPNALAEILAASGAVEEARANQCPYPRPRRQKNDAPGTPWQGPKTRAARWRPTPLGDRRSRSPLQSGGPLACMTPAELLSALGRLLQPCFRKV